MKSELEPWKVDVRAAFLQAMQNNKSANLLEIGAGPGRDSLFSKKKVIRSHVRIFRRRWFESASKENWTLVMDYYELDFPVGTFDAIYAMNCLLHTPKDQIRDVLGEIHRVLQPQGLFYLGVYGGQDSEGILENDTYEPKRFFSFFTDERMKALVKEYYRVETFHVIKNQAEGLHYRSMVLRKME